MYRPVIAIICLTSALGTGRASESRTRLIPTPVTALSITPDGNNLEQTENQVLHLWHMTGEQSAHSYIADIASRAHDPDSCKNTLESLMRLSVDGAIIKQGDTLLAMLKPGSKSIEVYDKKFEELNPCTHDNLKSDSTGLQGDPVAPYIDVFNMSRSDKSPDHKATNHYINSVVDKARSPQECRSELEMFAELARNHTAEIKLIGDKPVGITARDGVNLLVIDLQDYRTHTSCVAMTPK